MRLTYTVSPADASLTLRALLTERLRLSNAQRAACVEAGGVLVDGAFFYANQRPPVGAVISAELPTPPPMEVPVEESPLLSIAFEDEALLIADKPAGMLVHPSRAQYSGTLLSAVLGHLRRTGQPLCAHPAHRLDRGTSGLVMFAKHPHVQARLMEAMARGQLRKEYEALAFGEFPSGAGEIVLPIARERTQEGAGRPSQRRTVRGDGQPALTRYRVLERLNVRGRAVGRVAFEPVTGRTHQLRVHSLVAGCPLLGDPLYCTPESQALSRELGLCEQMLHAGRLRFPHPLSGAEIRVESPARWPRSLLDQR